MRPIIQLSADFAFEGASTNEITAEAQAMAQAADPLGPLAELPGPGETPGTWVGHGFNAIWRPADFPAPGQDRFLELNLTDETLVFTRIPGEIPNRGLAMPDINMFGVTYLQQINEAGHPDQGLHIEPGVWANVPQTNNPAEPSTVVRMASIPHGTVINAQGTWRILAGGPQQIPDNNIFPFFFGQPVPANSAFGQTVGNFPELDLSRQTQFRSASQGVTQGMVNNPNSVIQQALQTSLQGTSMNGRTFLHVSTTNNPIKGGGGVANTAFLEAALISGGGNARAGSVDVTFWIETIAGTGGQPDILQLQYTQSVILDFNGIHWPHVTVATLRKQ